MFETVAENVRLAGCVYVAKRYISSLSDVMNTSKLTTMAFTSSGAASACQHRAASDSHTEGKKESIFGCRRRLELSLVTLNVAEHSRQNPFEHSEVKMAGGWDLVLRAER